MGLLSNLFRRPLSQDKFARMLIKRIRASGDARPVEYDPDQFSLRRDEDKLFFLNNFYQEYLRIPKELQETLVQKFLVSWHTSDVQTPKDFADARADLLPALRARSYLEIDLHRVAANFRSELELPQQDVADHLVATLVYDLPDTMKSVSDEDLKQWEVTFYEAMEVAKENLAARTSQYAKMGGVCIVETGDAYDATRMLLTDFVESMEVAGDRIAMVPNREVLLVCGSKDADGLGVMAKLAADAIQHERWISGLAYRLDGGGWETWLPPEVHPAYAAFRELQLQTVGRIYAEQKELLDQRHALEGIDVFVASFTGMQNEHTGRIRSVCTWTEGADSLLPESDEIWLVRPAAAKEAAIAARGDWQTVRRVVGDLMELQDMYPVRWRVREFPSEAMLQEIGDPE